MAGLDRLAVPLPLGDNPVDHWRVSAGSYPGLKESDFGPAQPGRGQAVVFDDPVRNWTAYS